jgi:hypothetical protein
MLARWAVANVSPMGCEFLFISPPAEDMEAAVEDELVDRARAMGLAIEELRS